MNILMIKKWKGATFLVIALVLLLVLAGCSSDNSGQSEGNLPTVMVYKSPTCGCCENWVNHLRANGFKVQAQNVDNIMAVKQERGVPGELASCHTAIIGDYIVEGHVPAKDIKRMLSEKPDIAGLAVPGMPVGSPGMEVQGRAPQPFNVISFDRAGNTRVFAEYSQ